MGWLIFSKPFISIHALREEGDLAEGGGADGKGYFYPRPPRGGRPAAISANLFIVNFYPRPPRGGRHRFGRGRGQRPEISIHALREEGDFKTRSVWMQSVNFYPRPPRGGRHGHTFQITSTADISIHALREEGDLMLVTLCPRARFLSTPSARRATAVDEGKISSLKFLSTPSARRATMHLGFTVQAADISIHALREEGDRLFLEEV